MNAVFKREFRSYFSTPIGFIVIAAFYFFLGLYFSIIYQSGSPDISMVIMAMSTVAVFTMPVLTMRLMSEDRRQKVDQALLTAPVKLTGIVLGIYALFGMLLLGSALIAIGMFISSLTESSVISAILTLVINILVLYVSNFASMIKISWLAAVVEKAAFISAAENFSENVLSVADILYFVSISVAFLFLCVRSLDKRRWA